MRSIMLLCVQQVGDQECHSSLKWFLTTDSSSDKDTYLELKQVWQTIKSHVSFLKIERCQNQTISATVKSRIKSLLLALSLIRFGEVLSSDSLSTFYWVLFCWPFPDMFTSK